MLANSISPVWAQSPGFIIRPATGSGASILDPNSDGYTSKTQVGFGANDTDTSKTEIRYKIVRPFLYEPTGDLLRGPGGGFSDLVTQVDSSGFYVFNDGTRLLFRLRIGDYIPGSKGYSILIDTDGRFGYSGALADPGFTPATNSTNGNPGFEFEVVLETNFRVAVYNTDTAGKVVLKHANIPFTDFSQVSVAGSYVSGNADYFIDFFVPFAQLGINANTPLRMTATTVMSPQAAIGGTKSDIFGLNSSGGDYMNAWTQIITNATPVTLGNLTSNAPLSIPVCTAVPTLNPPTIGSTTVTGSWTRLAASKQGAALIRLYRNGVLTDSVIATTGNGWSIPVSAITTGQSFYAVAQATGEGSCFQSHTVVPVKCTGAPSARPAVTCALPKGLDGTFPVSGTRIRIYQNVVPGVAGLSGFTIYADSAAAPGNFSQVTSAFVLHDNTTRKWKCDGTDGNGQPGSISNTACNGGNTNDMPLYTALAVTAQEPGKCESMPLFICPNGTLTATPSVSAAVLYPGASVSGVTVPNGYVRLYVDSVLTGAAFADPSGNYIFSNPGLTTGSRVDICAQSSATTCVSNFVSRTVLCYTSSPSIHTDNSGYIAPGSTAISGRSYEANGSVVTVYKKLLPSGPVTLVGQAVVNANAWSMNIPAALANERYTAVQQNGSCNASDTSSPALVPSVATLSCASFAAGNYLSNGTSVTGSVSPALSNGNVYLYIDGSLADSATGVTSTFSINTNTTVFNRLYAGALLTLTTRTSGGNEKTDCASATATVSCTAPVVPIYTVSATSIPVNGTTTFTLDNAISGVLYTVTDTSYSGKTYSSSQFASAAQLQLPTYAFSSAGNYPVMIQAVKISEGSACRCASTASVMRVSNGVVLPLQLLSFSGNIIEDKAQLSWTTTGEQQTVRYVVERSADGLHFNAAGSKLSANDGLQTHTYTFTDAVPLNGPAYYRLLIDDGRVTYSHTILLRAATGSNNGALWPNPFRSQLYLRADFPADAPATVQIMDIKGRAIKTYEMHAVKGTSAFPVSFPDLLPAGIYFLKVLQGNTLIIQQRIEKLP